MKIEEILDRMVEKGALTGFEPTVNGYGLFNGNDGYSARVVLNNGTHVVGIENINAYPTDVVKRICGEYGLKTQIEGNDGKRYAVDSNLDSLAGAILRVMMAEKELSGFHECCGECENM